MSAFGTKRTSLVAPHMSAIGGKADMGFRIAKCPLMTQSGHNPLQGRKFSRYNHLVSIGFR